jgi:hypothetical protein
MSQKPLTLLCLPSVGSIDQIVEKLRFPVRLTKSKYKDIEFIVEDTVPTIMRKGVDLNSFSFVWLSSSWRSRDLAYAVKLYLDRSETPCTYVEKGTSKVTDQMIFGLGGIQAPNTLFFDNNDVTGHLDRIKEVCGYPLIIKDIKGARGACSEYVETEVELLKKMEGLPKHKKYLFQAFIPNEYDWGVMVSNGKVVSGEKSYPAEGEFRNNTCNGAREVFVDPDAIPQNIKEMAIKATALLGLGWARADIIVDKDSKEPYLLEVNRFPGITAETTEVDGGYAFLSSQMKKLSNM